jgi:serine/threonine protein kinase
VLIFVLGTNFRLLQVHSTPPTRWGAFLLALLSTVSFLFLIVYLLGYYFHESLAIIEDNVTLLILLSILSIFLLIYFIHEPKTEKFLGIAMVLPFSLVTFLDLFIIEFLYFAKSYGYVISIILIIVTLAGILTFVRVAKKRQWANILLSGIYLISVIYGVIQEGKYFSNFYFYLIFSLFMFISAVLISNTYTKMQNILPSDFFYTNWKFGTKIEKLLHFTIIMLILIGFFLIIPKSFKVISLLGIISVYLSTLTAAYYIEQKAINSAFRFSIFLIYIIVALYGLLFIIMIIPQPFLTGNMSERFLIWLGISAALFYQPFYNILDDISGNKLPRQGSISYLIDRLRNRSRLLNGRYILGPELGKGGTANVYEGFDYKKSQQVVIKIPVILCPNENCNWRDEDIPIDERCPQCGSKLDINNFKDAITLLKQEKRALEYLSYPSIVKQIDLFDEGGKTYLVEELVKGISFFKLFDPNHKFDDEKDVISLTKKILYALHYVHVHGILHRDLNPGNIMLINATEIKIIDFGTAKFKNKRSQASGKPSVGKNFGTYEYAPPEWQLDYLLNSGEPGFSYDLYSVGGLMYLMRTGESPDGLDIKNYKFKYDRNLKYREDFKNKLNGLFTPKVLTVILKATAFQPKDRYQSAFEMLCALEGRSGEFIVSEDGEAYELPQNGSSNLHIILTITFVKNKKHNQQPFFKSAGPSINLTVEKQSLIKKDIEVEITYDYNLKQYKILPKKDRIYFGIINEKNQILMKELEETGYYLGRKIILFSSSSSPSDFIFGYFKV